MPAIRSEVTVCVDCPYCMVPGGGQGSYGATPLQPNIQGKGYSCHGCGDPTESGDEPKGRLQLMVRSRPILRKRGWRVFDAVLMVLWESECSKELMADCRRPEKAHGCRGV